MLADWVRGQGIYLLLNIREVCRLMTHYGVLCARVLVVLPVTAVSVLVLCRGSLA